MATNPLFDKALTEFLCSCTAQVCPTGRLDETAHRWQLFAVGYPDCPLASFPNPSTAIQWAITKVGAPRRSLAIVVLNTGGRIIGEYNA